MRYNPNGLLLAETNNKRLLRLSTTKKWPLTDPVRVVVIVMAVLSTNCILVWLAPHTISCSCHTCMFSEYRALTVGEVSGLTALPEVTGIVTSSLQTLKSAPDLR